MDPKLIEIAECNDVSKKYDLVIRYMEANGIEFREASPDHTKNHYRIIENGSSIFVYSRLYEMKITDKDKDKLQGVPQLAFEVTYKSKKDKIVDGVRPWTIKFTDVEILEKIVNRLRKVPVIVDDINVPRKPRGYDDAGNVICPRCGYHFEKAPRCPEIECGQLIDYSEKEKRQQVKYRDKYRDAFKDYFIDRKTKERALQGKEPLKSPGTNVSDIFHIEDIREDKDFSYWLESEERFEEAREVLIEEFTRRGRKTPEQDANQYIRNMRYFKDFLDEYNKKTKL